MYKSEETYRGKNDGENMLHEKGIQPSEYYGKTNRNGCKQ